MILRGHFFAEKT